MYEILGVVETSNELPAIKVGAGGCVTNTVAIICLGVVETSNELPAIKVGTGGCTVAVDIEIVAIIY